MPGTTEKNGAEYIREVGGYLEIRKKLGAGHTSSTGKSQVIVSTGGFTECTGPTGLRVSVLAIRKTKKG